MPHTHEKLFSIAVADPYVLAAPDGRYYLYGSSDDGVFRAHSSPDMLSWREEGEIYRATSDGWCVDCLWAPECYYFGGKYYLFFSANWRENPNGEEENFRIGVAVSDNPTGPFCDLMNQPVFDPGYPIIDANVYFEDGRYYLYYSRCCYKHLVGDCEESWIYGVELEPDFRGIRGEPILLLKPEQPWERRSKDRTSRCWNEGSFLVKRGGRYYMTFSANYYAEDDYCVGYATSEAPLGHFVKAAENPILKRSVAVGGPGHGCVVQTPVGECVFIHHGRTTFTGNTRIGFMNRIIWDDAGRIRMMSPSFPLQLAP